MKLPTAILAGPPLPGTRLEDDLRALGFTLRVAEGCEALTGALAEVPAGEPVAVVDPRFVGHRHSLRLALADPRFPAAAVPGVIAARPAARQALAAAARLVQAAAGAAPAAARVPRGGPAPAPAAGDCLPDALAARLRDAGTAVHHPDLGPLVAAVPTTAAARESAEAAVAGTDEEALRLRAAVKARDGFFTTHFVSPYSRYLARWCARRGLTPNQVTTASLLVALAAAACAATGTRAGYLAAGPLLLASFVLDCADGQLARYSLRYSTLGAWLDATFDRAKEYAFYAGLALGAATGGEDVWGLALGAMALQTCRHLLDSGYALSLTPGGPPDPRDTADRDTADRDTADRDTADRDTADRAAPAGGAAGLSRRLDGIKWTVWLRRMIVLPIGERWALLAVLTALTSPRVTLTTLLLAGGFAAAYTTAGRLLRSLAALRRRELRAPAAARQLAALADTGPPGEALHRLPAPAAESRHPLAAPLWALAAAALLPVFLLVSGTVGEWPSLAAAVLYAVCAARATAVLPRHALDWLVPPLFRAAEYATVLVLAARSDVNGALPAAYVLVAACAYHHYDTVYRLRGGAGAPPRWLNRATGGHEGRLLVVTAAAVLGAGGQGFTGTLAVLGGTVSTLVLAESIRFWTLDHAPAVHDETGVPG